MQHAVPGHRLRAASSVIAALLVAVLSAVPARAAATTELMVADRFSGVALYGFDPVAYFLDQKARPGMEAFELSFGGLIWRFRNEGNRAAFVAKPDTYVPRFGGYDPIALMRGAPVPGHPVLFVIHDGQLFLFHSLESRGAFLARPDTTIEAARSAWPKVARTLVP